METVAEPDVTTERCPSCGGLFLDSGELDALASGIAGDVEWRFARNTQAFDSHAARTCARCPGSTMSKCALLLFSDLVFDRCDSCGSFFLDEGELATMNDQLGRTSKSGEAEEFRGLVGGHLVRVRAAFETYDTAGHPGYCLQITVYFGQPVGAGLRMYRESLAAKLAKLFARRQDIETGDAELDGAFMIQGDDPGRITGLLSFSHLRDALLGLAKAKLRVFSRDGAVEVVDDRIVYTEGLYRERPLYDPETDSEGIVSKMLAVADAVDMALER